MQHPASRTFPYRLALLLTAVLAATAALGASARGASSRYFVVLEGEPLAPTSETTPGRNAAPAAAERRAELIRSQDTAAAAVIARGGQVLERFSLLNRALFVELPADQADALRAQPGVRGVFPERHYQRRLATSVPFSGAGRAWTGLSGVPGVTGRNLRIGIIDSGIDYTHADFGGAGTVAAHQANDPTQIEAGTFPTTKVLGGTDFVGDNYDSSGNNGSFTPQPDPDPLDPNGTGHGTHVAGIAGGQGVLKDGTPYTGPYTATLDPKQFEIGPGVAPEAGLYALKVFGAQGSTSSSIVVKALNWAADPNGDGDTSDHLEVVNLSLGSVFGDDLPGDPEREAIDRVVRLGCIVTCSAGNAGDTAFKIDSPASAPRAIAVANSLDDGFTTEALRVEAPASVAGLYPTVEAEFTPGLATVGPVRARVVATNPRLGCDPLVNAAAVSGKIALMDRGTCLFTEKILTAQAAGAIAVVMVNNVEGPPFVMSGDPGDFRIPAVMLSQADGNRLRAQIANGLEVTLSADVEIRNTELADTVDSSSSRGPTWEEGMLKPDLAAPGASIISAKSAGGSVGIAQSGTSMSSPHAAGAAALVRQAHPGWLAEDIKAVLMNTAVTPMRTSDGAPYSESRVGAGRIAVDRAIRSQISIRAEADSGRVSLSFGTVFAEGPITRNGAFILSNHGDTPVTYQVASSNTLVNPGVRLVPLVNQITVPAQGTARVAVRLEVNPAEFLARPVQGSAESVAGFPRHVLPEGTGELWFLGGPLELHVPWYSIIRPLSSQLVGARSLGTPNGNTPILRIPTRGTSGHRRPVVGVFQLGVTHPDRNFGDSRDATDILATGAASDVATASSFAATRIFFALVTAGSWPTPQRYFQDLEIEVDLDNDDIVDIVLANNNLGSALGDQLEDYEGANDALLTAIDYLDGGSLDFGDTWNGLDPAIADTPAFKTAAVIHSVTADQLFLSAGSSTFRYRALTRGEFSETSGWARFDAAKPVVDATRYGVDRTPWLDEGRNVRALLSRPNATAAGIAANGTVSLLLVHAQGRPGSQAEVVRANLAGPDFDGDGLADEVEMLQVGDLDDTADSDRDQDGFSTQDELTAGTNPTDPASRLVLLPPVTAGDPVRWQSVVGRRYAVLRAGNVAGPYTVWQSGVQASDVTTSLADPDVLNGSQTFFYRIQVEP